MFDGVLSFFLTMLHVPRKNQLKPILICTLSLPPSPSLPPRPSSLPPSLSQVHHVLSGGVTDPLMPDQCILPDHPIVRPLKPCSRKTAFHLCFETPRHPTVDTPRKWRHSRRKLPGWMAGMALVLRVGMEMPLGRVTVEMGFRVSGDSRLTSKVFFLCRTPLGSYFHKNTAQNRVGHSSRSPMEGCPLRWGRILPHQA